MIASRGRHVLRIAAIAALASLVHASPAAGADRAEECAEQAEQASDLRDKGQLLEAVKRYETCAADACPRVVREDCRAALLELRQSIPRITIHVRDAAGKDVIDGQVDVDGVSVSATDCANGVQVDPGVHHIQVRRSSSAPHTPDLTQTVNVAASDRIRAVDLVLADPTLEALPPPKKASKNHTPAIVVGTIGLGFVAAFGAIGGWTLADYERLKSTCGGDCTPAQVDPVRTRGVVADTFLGVGIIGLAVGTVLWFTAGEPEPRKAGFQF